MISELFFFFLYEDLLVSLSWTEIDFDICVSNVSISYWEIVEAPRSRDFFNIGKSSCEGSMIDSADFIFRRFVFLSVLPRFFFYECGRGIIRYLLSSSDDEYVIHPPCRLQRRFQR